MLNRASIRAALDADLPAVRRIVDAAYSPYLARLGKPPGPMLEDYAIYVGTDQLWVIEHAEAVVGLVVLVAMPEYLLLDNVAVDPGRHGQGLGSALMRFAEDEARRRGYREMRLYTHVTMTENQAIYLRLGWTETGRANQQGYDRVFFSKRLAGGTA